MTNRLVFNISLHSKAGGEREEGERNNNNSHRKSVGIMFSNCCMTEVKKKIRAKIKTLSH